MVDRTEGVMWTCSCVQCIFHTDWGEGGDLLRAEDIISFMSQYCALQENANMNQVLGAMLTMARAENGQ